MGKKEKGAVKGADQPKDKFDGLLLELKDIKSAILNLGSDEDEVLANTCHACFNFVIKDREQNSVVLLEFGAVERLIVLMTSADKSVRRHSLMVLGLMSSVQTVRKVLAEDKQKIIQDCSTLVQDDDAVVVEFAVAILANLAAVYQIKEEIIENGSLPAIIKLLSSNDPDTKKHALVCLLSLAQDMEIRSTLADIEAVVSVIGLIISDYPVIQQLALNLCSILCLEQSSCDQLVANDGLNKLLLFVENQEYNDIHTHALETIARCLSNDEILNQFHDSGALAKLILAIKTSLETQTGEECGIYFSDFIFEMNKSHKIFTENGIAEILFKMLNQVNDEPKISACRSARILAAEPTFRDQCADMGITTKIVALLSSPNLEVRRQAILTIGELIRNNETNMGIISSNKVMVTAINLLEDGDHGMICGSLSVLVTIAKDTPGSSSEAHEANLIPQLENISEIESTQIQNKMLDVIAIYVITPEDRKLLYSSTLLGTMVQLLASNDKAVRISACMAIQAVCRDEATAKALVDGGIIDVIQRVQQSSHLRSHLADATLNQVLDFDLSAKYSIKRKLQQINHIKNGFYDAGIIHPKGKFCPLQLLAKNEINDKVPILYISLPDRIIDDSKSHHITASNYGIVKSNYLLPDEKKGSSGGKSKRKREENSLKPPGSPSTPAKPKLSRNSVSTTILIAPEPVDESEQSESIEETNQNDKHLTEMIQTTISKLNNQQTIETQISIIGKSVSDFFGGSIEKSKLYEFGYEISIVQLKRSKLSNVLPLGCIKKGLYRERALLFKLICDQIYIPVSLEQGEYGRAWNSIFMEGKENVVDLISCPGEMYRADQPLANEYKTI